MLLKTFRHATIPLVCIVLFGAIAASLIISLTFGSVSYSAGAVYSVVQAKLFGLPLPEGPIVDVVWQLRAPRGVLAIVAGAGLALSGVAMQTLVRNPLADPYLLGVSSGASVGATAVITLGLFSSFGIYALTGGALVGAVAATVMVYAITLLQGGLTPLRLILTGVVMSSAFSAAASFLVFKGPDARAAQGVMFWMLGSVAGARWDRLVAPTVAVVITFVVLLLFHGSLDALTQGEDTAASLGVNVTLLRQVLFFLQAFAVGVIVSVAGGIGFVGLVIPHFARLLVGSLHRHVVPVAALLGALFLLWVDVLARISAPPQEIPLGVVTGVIGAPLFLILMGRGQLNQMGDR